MDGHWIAVQWSVFVPLKSVMILSMLVVPALHRIVLLSPSLWEAECVEILCIRH